MEKYFDLPGIGELFIEHQFYELNDEPILFVCKDDSSTRYLCSCCLMYEKWVVAQADEVELIDLMDDKITIRKVFETHIGTAILVSWDGSGFSVEQSVSSDYFPKKGAKLELPYEKEGAYYGKLTRIAQREALLRSLASATKATASYWQSCFDTSASLWKHMQPLVSEYTEVYKRLVPVLQKFATYCSEIPTSDVMQRVADASNTNNTTEDTATVSQTLKMPKKLRDGAELREQVGNEYDCFAA